MQRHLKQRNSFCYKMVHYGIWDGCIVGFVNLSSVEATQIIITTTCNATNDDRIGNMITHSF